MFRVQIGSEIHAAGPAIVNELCQQDVSVYVKQQNHHVSMIGDGDRYSGYTGRSGTRAPCHGKHQASRPTVCRLHTCEPVISVNM